MTKHCERGFARSNECHNKILTGFLNLIPFAGGQGKTVAAKEAGYVADEIAQLKGLGVLG